MRRAGAVLHPMKHIYPPPHMTHMCDVQAASFTPPADLELSGRWLAHINHELKCPITMSRMSDPVITCDGHSYQRDAIVQWLRRHETSPKSNLVLPSKALVTNRNIALMASIVKLEEEDD